MNSVFMRTLAFFLIMPGLAHADLREDYIEAYRQITGLDGVHPRMSFVLGGKSLQNGSDCSGSLVIAFQWTKHPELKILDHKGLPIAAEHLRGYRYHGYMDNDHANFVDCTGALQMGDLLLVEGLKQSSSHKTCSTPTHWVGVSNNTQITDWKLRSLKQEPVFGIVHLTEEHGALDGVSSSLAHRICACTRHREFVPLYGTKPATNPPIITGRRRLIPELSDLFITRILNNTFTSKFGILRGEFTKDFMQNFSHMLDPAPSITSSFEACEGQVFPSDLLELASNEAACLKQDTETLVVTDAENLSISTQSNSIDRKDAKVNVINLQGKKTALTANRKICGCLHNTWTTGNFR